MLGFEDDAVGALPDATEDAVLVHVGQRRPDPPLPGSSAGQSVQALPSNNVSSSCSPQHVTGKTHAELSQESASPLGSTFPTLRQSPENDLTPQIRPRRHVTNATACGREGQGHASEGCVHALRGGASAREVPRAGDIQKQAGVPNARI